MVSGLLIGGWLIVGLAGVFAFELPSFLPKCSLSNPNLGDCIKENANKVIPIIAKGVPELGITSVSPLRLPVAEVKTLDLIVQDVYDDDLKNLKVTNASFDLKNGKIQFALYLDRIDSLSQNYTFTNGVLFGLPVSGHGKYNVTMTGVTVDYTGDIKTYGRNGETYVEITNAKASTNVERGYYHFENIKSPRESDVNRYIDDHWKDYRAKLKPAFDFYLAASIHAPIGRMFEHVPLNKIFLP
ncbi:hypothetical protein Trydic_g9022 [Trypoxylus dichotomus]